MPSPDGANRAARQAALIRALAPKTHPESSRPSSGRVLQRYRKSDAVHLALRDLAANPDPAVGRLLLECLADHKFNAWRPNLQHALAQHMRILRDTSFRPPSSRMVLDALAGKAPANAADLRAIVVEELQRLGRELRTDPTSPWRFYWNTDQYGKPAEAKIENLCRDITLSIVTERLKPYSIQASMPEVLRGLDTRADVMILTGAGRNLPVEAKRHYHSDLWTAGSTQLQGYAAAEGADGNGVLLIFWFGLDWSPPPARAGHQAPANAGELQKLLAEDLPPGIRERTDIIVLDVSRPEGGPARSTFAKKGGRASSAQSGAKSKPAARSGAATRKRRTSKPAADGSSEQ